MNIFSNYTSIETQNIQKEMEVYVPYDNKQLLDEYDGDEII